MLTPNRLIITVALFISLIANLTFFRNTLAVYTLADGNSFFIASLMLVIIAFNVFLFGLLAVGKLLKPVLILMLLIAASSAYFMDSYNIIVDITMLDNVMATDLREATDLFSWKFLWYLLFIFLLPSLLIYRLKLPRYTLKQASLKRLALLGISLFIIVANVLIMSKYYTSFFREHKVLRSYVTPGYPVFSVYKFIQRGLKDGNKPVQPLGRDATISATANGPKLVVLVVGEAARADHFSLNGYNRNTNPELAQKNIISFTNIWSCGTSTAESVPCMFSSLPRKRYNKNKARQIENVLDVLGHAGVNIYWLDNNSSSKGVAKRFKSIDLRKADANPVCDPECRDIGMLPQLQRLVEAHKQGNILIVLHQMGSHGPAYYKRYPQEFQKFTPICKTNQLEKCSQAEINNAYDNTILYTDYFLSQLITQLQKNNADIETAMIYIADHGESLGENNLYLHGLPYMIAPDTQKRVAMVTWFNDKILVDDIDFLSLNERKGQHYSHDNLFHTLLGLFNLETEAYDPALDMLK